MSERVEREGEDGIFVCFDEGGGWFGRVGVGEGVVVYRTC